MTKIIALFLTVTLTLLAFASCSKPKGKTLDEVKAAGKLVVATSPDFPPFEYLDEANSNEVVGIEIDIMKLVCEKLGVTLEIKQMDFDSVLVGIQAAKYDIAVSGITVNAKREKNMRFTSPYYIAAQSIVVKEDSAIASKADLTGKKISVQTGTTAEDYCMGEGYEVLAFTANNDAAAALTAGKADAWVVDNEVAVALAAEQGLVVLDEAMTSEPYAFAFPKGSETLVSEFNKIITEMIADGTIQSIFDQYGVLYVSP